MSIRIMAAVWDCGPSSPPQRLLLLALADNANDQAVCWPSVDTLARKCAVEPRTLQRTLRQLELDGWITRTERPGRSTYYTLQERMLTPDATVTPDASVTPAPSVTPTPDTHVTPPLTLVSPEPSMNHQGNRQKDSSAADAAASFVEFWALAVRKTGKGAALRAWARLKPDDRAAALDGWRSARDAWCTWPVDRQQFIPHPTTWLSQRRWEDDAPEPYRHTPAQLDRRAGGDHWEQPGAGW